jgi:hypothetical protein
VKVWKIEQDFNYTYLIKTVSIEGSMFEDDFKLSLCGFSTMYRDGIDENELFEGVENMRKSPVYTQEPNEWTSFTYHLKNSLKK